MSPSPPSTPSKRLRLLFCVKALHGAAGGAERVLATITAGLAKLGHDVTVASFDQPDEAPFYTFAEDVVQVRLGTGRTQVSSSPVDILRRAVAMRRLAMRLRPDVVTGFMNSAFVPLALGLVGTGVPVVASEHISYSHYTHRPVERWLLTLVNRLAARMTIPSESIRQGFPTKFLPNMVAVENPVETPVAVPSADAQAPEPLLLGAGRFTPQKDFATLIAAFARLANTFPEWRLRILGDGALRPAMEAQIAAAQIGERVALPGIVTDMPGEYRRAGIFVMSSRYESMGLVTAEALAHGLPAIGFADCPGTRDLIRPGINGLLVDGTDRVTALAEGLSTLMADQAMRSGMAARAPATMAHLLGDAVVDKWNRLFDAVVEGRTRTGFQRHG